MTVDREDSFAKRDKRALHRKARADRVAVWTDMTANDDVALVDDERLQSTLISP